VKDLFVDWLDRHVPERKEKIVNRILAMRGGRLNDPRLGSRMRAKDPWPNRSYSSLLWHGRRRGWTAHRPSCPLRHSGGLDT